MSLVSGSEANFGSTKKVTGMRTVSPGLSVCSVKQKHWILLKYWPVSSGGTLNAACPAVVLFDRLLAVNTAVSTEPIWPVTGFDGATRQGRVASMLESSRTVIGRAM